MNKKDEKEKIIPNNTIKEIKKEKVTPKNTQLRHVATKIESSSITASIQPKSFFIKKPSQMKKARIFL